MKRNIMGPTVWALALLVASAAHLASSGICNKKEFYCASPSVYQFCLDGSNTTNTDPLVCPEGTRCSFDCDEPCLPSMKTPCKGCLGNNSFYCPNENSFQVCLVGSNVTESKVYPCGSGSVCSNYCEDECTAKACNPPICNNTAGKRPNPDNPKNFYVCSVNKDGVVTIEEHSCADLSVFDAGNKTCVAVKAPEVAPYNCSAVGRFPDPSGNKGYYLCSTDSAGALVGVYLPCPTGTVYNSETKKCTSSLQTTTEKTTTTKAPPFKCSDTGKYPDAADCHSFYLCTSGQNSTFLSTHYYCPGESFFDPKSSRCTMVQPDNCVVRARKWTAPAFRCSESGRFADPDSCLSYYWCSPEEDDTFEVFHFPCPDSSRFNPETKKCTFSDDFPCAG